jgi:hypothetical protein
VHGRAGARTRPAAGTFAPGPIPRGKDLMLTYEGRPWIPAPPTHYQKGRQGYSILWGVVHTTESPEGVAGAEANARYLQTRSDLVSFHSVVNADSMVRCVRDEDTAYCARNPANLRGLHQEIVGRAGQTAAQWADEMSTRTLGNATRDMAWWCHKHSIPPVWLSDQGLRDRDKGLTTHAQLSDVFGGTHWDPGPNFPAGPYLTAVKQNLDQIGGSDVTEQMASDIAFLKRRMEYVVPRVEELVQSRQAAEQRLAVLEAAIAFLKEREQYATPRIEELVQFHLDAERRIADLEAAINALTAPAP